MEISKRDFFTWDCKEHVEYVNEDVFGKLLLWNFYICLKGIDYKIYIIIFDECKITQQYYYTYTYYDTVKSGM